MKTISERIKEALELRDMKQADLVEKTGIGKSSISTYISGSYEPKQRNIYKIAKALDVSEAWLMGHDVPMERMQTLSFSTKPDNTPYARAIEKMNKGIKPSKDEMKAFKEEFPKTLKRIPEIFNDFSNNIYEAHLLAHYKLLNDEGKQEAIKRVEELTYIPSYTQSEDTLLDAAHAIEGASKEDKQHDEDIMNDDSFWE